MLVAGLLLALVSAVTTATGTARLLAWLPKVTVTEPDGPLLGDFSARRIVVDLGSAEHPDERIVLERPAWRGLQLSRSALPGILARLEWQSLSVERIEVVTTPSAEPDPPLQPPQTLRLPVLLRVERLSIGELLLPGLGEPLRGLQARVDLGGDNGERHRIDQLEVDWGRLRLQGEAGVLSDAPLTTQARVAIAQRVPAADGELGWSAQAQADGPLARLQVGATVRAQGQSLDAQAVVTPFAAQPVDQLDAALKAFDLAAFSDAAPRTALSGDVRVALRSDAGNPGTGSGLPLDVTIRLDNPLADRWDLQRLPVRRLEAQAQGRAGDPDEGVLLDRLRLELGTARAPGGVVTGSGRWLPQRWQADLTLDGLQPGQLDERAPAVTLSGPVNLVAAPTPGAAASSAPPAGAGSTVPPMSDWPIELKADLRGQVPTAGERRTVTLQLEGRVSAGSASLTRLRAASGDATLDATGAWAATARGGHAVQLSSRWQAFDPALWWPGPAGSPWRTQTHRLTGQAEADLTWQPAPASSAGTRTAGTPPAWSRIGGKLQLALRDSRIAGLPLEGELQAEGATSGLVSQGRLTLADQRLAWQGRLMHGGSSPGSAPADSAMSVEIEAPALERLAPLLSWWVERPQPGGRLSARGEVSGRWEQLAATGQASASDLRWADTRVGSLEGRWALALPARANQSATLRLGDVQLGTRRVPTATLTLSGTGLAHELRLTGATPFAAPWGRQGAASAPSTRPSAAGTGAPPAPTPAPTPTPAKEESAQLELTLRGGVSAPQADSLLTDLTGWKGGLEQLEVGPAPVAAARAQTPAPWLSVRDVGAEWQRGRPGDARTPALPQRLSLTEGRALLQASGQRATVRWSRIVWQEAIAGAPGVLEARAELEPLAVAPLLRELQPNFGWSGDLQMTASVNLRSAPTFSADVELARTGGDLQIEEAGLVERLGLSELRLALTAREGTWRFTQAVTGSNLGTVQGEQIVRTDTQAMWPRPDASLDGRIEVKVDNLATWAAWVPAGWRLGGQLQAQARVGGRMGAPEYTGEVRGRDLTARNMLAGVHLRDGEVDIRLDGPTARIETLRASAGEGTARVEGGASFGAEPRAELRLVAERFALLSRVDRRVTASGQAQVKLDATSFQAEGRFKVDEGLYDISRSDAPSLSDDVVVRRTDEPPASSQDSARPPVRRNVSLNLALDLGERFRLKGRGLDTRLAGDLRLTTPGGRMTLVGDIRTVDGTYAAYGQKLTIDRGVISFVGTPDNPRLDIEATRPNTDIRVGVAVGGTAQSPRVRLFSEPEMSDTDKLSWLVLGRAPGQLGRTESALLQRAVLALLAGEGDSPTAELSSTLGLDQLSIRQDEAGGVSETIVSLGRQISQRWYVGYERSLNATAGSWQLIYRVAQRFTVRAQAGADNSVDLIWTWRW